MKKALFIVLLISLSLLILAFPAQAKDELTFSATQIYWEAPYQLAVVGYFQNTGTETITGVNSFYLAIYYLYGSKYYLLGSGTWINSPELTNIVLKPGETSSWTLYINTDSHPSFVYWVADWKVQYNYLH